MRAALYSRFSTDRQNESSIADQVRVCSDYIHRQGWTVVDRFEDQGISGAALGNRPGVLRLQEDALARRFDVVVVMDLTRLSRSQGDLSKMIDRLTMKGIRIIGVQDGYDSARRGHKLQAGLSGIIGEAFREMVKDRTYAALESRAKAGRPTGGRAYGYRDGKIDRGEAFIVLEIFGRFADGMSPRSIAADLNTRRIPSPGASWKRSQRRADGWMGSGIRVILRNERYRGVVHWNTSEWRKDPDTGKRKRVMRPRSEWVTSADESLRIVSDELWERAQRRVRPPKEGARVRSGGKPKFLLSGLLVCDTCGAHYVITDQRSYGCSSFHDGRACFNGVRVRRQRAEAVLLDPIRKGLLSPERVERMAKEMRALYVEHLRALQMREAERPQELQELIARIERLRERLRRGDPDMTPDEIQAAIERAEAKARELGGMQAAPTPAMKAFTMLPRAAEAYRRQIALGLEGEPRAAAKARLILRELFGGEIRLVPEPGGGLTAHWNLHTSALVKTLGTSGSGGRI
ncbi:MAG TPA: recombinase family protein [Steroidobacter sp.]|uniref:recombinase family protein n=1 Tax=Steroidobacter sp. TaxID=1978227 RepID=UPI002EDA8680